MADAATQAPQAPKGQDYGAQKRQIEAQQVQPIAGAPSPGGAPAGGGGVPPMMAPGSVPGLQDPSAMPGQPVTAGIPSGEGPGLNGLSTTSFGPPELAILRGIYLRAGSIENEDVRRLIEFTEQHLA